MTNKKEPATAAKLAECVNKAVRAVERNDHFDALLWYEKAIFFDPQNIQYYLDRANSYCKLYDIKSAISNLRKASQLPGGEKMEFRYRLADLLDCYAMLCLETGEPRVALAYSNEAIDHCNIKPNYLIHRALCNVYLGRLDLALNDIDNALSLGSTSVGPIILKAKLHYQQGESDLGDKAMKDAALLDKGHPEVVVFEARLQQANKEIYEQAVKSVLAKDFTTARGILTSALKENSNLDIKSRLLLGSTYRAMGEYDKALENLADATDWYLDQREWQHGQQIRLAKARVAERKRDKKQGVFRGNSDEEEAYDLNILKEKDVVFRDHPDIVRQRCLIFNDMAMQEFTNAKYSAAILLLNRAISAISAQQNELKVNSSGPVLRKRGCSTNRTVGDMHH